MLIREIMTKDVVTVSPKMNVHTLAELFIEKNISGAPVVNDEGKLLGLVLEEGLIFQDKKVHLPTFVSLSLGFLTLGTHRYEEEIKRITGSTISDIMEKDFISLSPDNSLAEVATMMVEKGIYYYPIVEDEKLVGVVTKKDIVRVIAQKNI